MGKTYLTGKIGKSVKFNPRTWGSIGGDNEAPTLILSLAKNNPDDKFIIIGKNDLDKLVERPSNLYSILDLADDKLLKERNPSYIWEALKDVRVDGCFLISGPTSSVNLLNCVYKRRDLKEGNLVFAKTLEMHANYSGPIYYYLNKSQIPWVMLNNDPRYLFMGRDCLNMPKKILSQYDGQVKLRSIPSFDDQTELIEHYIDYKYAEMEKIFLIGKEIERYEKTKKLLIVLNEGSNGVKGRYPLLKKFILDDIDDVEIYGKWSKETIGDDSRFCGSIPFTELQEKLRSVKYSFIIPIKSGWVTMKVWEMIGNGIIPFFHPTYDDQKHLSDLPDVLRVNNSKELHNRIEYLENNPDVYDKLLDMCFAAIKPHDIDGTNLSNIILGAADEVSNDYHSTGDTQISALSTKTNSLF